MYITEQSYNGVKKHESMTSYLRSTSHSCHHDDIFWIYVLFYVYVYHKRRFLSKTPQVSFFGQQQKKVKSKIDLRVRSCRSTEIVLMSVHRCKKLRNRRKWPQICMKMNHSGDRLELIYQLNVQALYFFWGPIWGLVFQCLCGMQIDFKTSKD